MCGACGVLRGGSDWIDGVGGEALPPHRRMAERRRRIELVNMLLDGSGVRLAEYGRDIVVRGVTGATRIVPDLAHVWSAADALGRRTVDPLDPGRQFPSASHGP